jgi:hypothetical protein
MSLGDFTILVAIGAIAAYAGMMLARWWRRSRDKKKDS